MWRFLCVLLASVSFSSAQTLILTFGDDTIDEIEAKNAKGCWYNVISNEDDVNNPYFRISAYSLKNADGSDFEYALSVAPIDSDEAAISSFAGDESDISKISGVFDIGAVKGVLSKESEVMLNFQKVEAGSYTLSVLAARGDLMKGADFLSTYYIDCSSPDDVLVKASVIAAHTRTWKLIEDSAKVEALTVNTSDKSNVAENWVLMQFDVTLLNEVKNLKLCASGNYGNVAAVAFSVVPEPSSSVLLLLSVVAVAGYRRRKCSY